MKLVLLTALGVGGATIFGAVLGFIFKKISHRFSDIVLSLAAGVMMCAAILGLILPSLEYEGPAPLLVTIAGVFCGALCLNILDKLVPHLHRLAGVDQESHPDNAAKLNKVLLFVMAIAIHNLPEGIAAGQLRYRKRGGGADGGGRHCPAEYSGGYGDHRPHAGCRNVSGADFGMRPCHRTY